MPVINCVGIAVDAHVVPSEVSTFPEVLGATNLTAEVPFPRITLSAVRVVAPVPPLATLNVPVVPFTIGSPVQFVSVPEDGVPRTGVVSVGVVIVGDVARTIPPEPVTF
jgi:hypothetical protein